MGWKCADGALTGPLLSCLLFFLQSVALATQVDIVMELDEVPNADRQAAFAGDWFQITTTSGPSPRHGAGMAYDWTGGRLILFGGHAASGPVNDTWTLDVATGVWTPLNLSGSPPTGGTLAMFDDYDNRSILLLGGPGGNRTWSFDGVNDRWTEISPAVRPPGRVNASVTYSVEENRLMIFGGCCDGGGSFDDAWEFDLTDSSWHELQAVNMPPAREGAILTWSGTPRLFGGKDGSTYLNDSWWYNAADQNWSAGGLPGPAPLGRAAASLSRTQRFQSQPSLLFGGQDSTGALNDSWMLYDQKLSPRTSPTPRWGHASAYDEASDRTVVFGGIGSGGVLLNDTWVFARGGVHPTPPGVPWSTSMRTENVNESSIRVELGWSRPPNGGSPLTSIQLFLGSHSDGPDPTRCKPTSLLAELPPESRGFNETIDIADLQYPHYSRTWLMAGNNALGEAPVRKCFRLISERPTLDSHSPPEGGSEVLRGTGVVLEFSQPMDPTSFRSAIAVDPTTDWKLTVRNTTAFLNFSSPLAPSTLYTVGVRDTATSRGGVRLDRDYSFNFTTVPLETRRIRGQVAETGGAGIPAARVEAIRLPDGVLAAADTTLDNGSYSLTLLSECDPSPCRYLLRVIYPGNVVEDGPEIALVEDMVVNFSRRPRSPQGASPALAIPVVGVGGGALALVLVLGGEALQLALLMLLAALYGRVTRDRVLDNFTRGRIYERIRADPGITFNRLRRALNLGNGTTVYHLYTLEREGMIRSRREGRFRRFFPVGLADAGVPTLLSQIQARILDLVKQNPGISQAEISTRLASPRQTVNYNMTRLIRRRMIRMEGWGWRKRCFCEEGEAVKSVTV